MTSADAFQSSAPYQVTKPLQLGLPSNENGEGMNDDETHREEYQVSRSRADRCSRGSRTWS